MLLLADAAAELSLLSTPAATTATITSSSTGRCAGAMLFYLKEAMVAVMMATHAVAFKE